MVIVFSVLQNQNPGLNPHWASSLAQVPGFLGMGAGGTGEKEVWRKGHVPYISQFNFANF